MNTPNDSDVICASAAADLFAVPHQVTGSHLARVAQLFADHRCKAEAPVEQMQAVLREDIISARIIAAENKGRNYGITRDAKFIEDRCNAILNGERWPKPKKPEPEPAFEPGCCPRDGDPCEHAGDGTKCRCDDVFWRTGR